MQRGFTVGAHDLIIAATAISLDYTVITAKTVYLNNVWCGECRSGASMQLREGEMSGRSLVLHGTCKKCGGEVARVIEPVES
ncbi:MAG: hypothetical protein PHF56_02855 [Desulfuromonadaceae bacterium]|nr:hypothetical protein [Desulfuromonadaceae bacterium]